MTKFLNKAKTFLNLLSNQWFYLIGILWMFASFLYIGKPHFWIVLGFGIMFTGVQNIINEIKSNTEL